MQITFYDIDNNFSEYINAKSKILRENKDLFYTKIWNKYFAKYLNQIKSLQCNNPTCISSCLNIDIKYIVDSNSHRFCINISFYQSVNNPNNVIVNVIEIITVNGTYNIELYDLLLGQISTIDDAQFNTLINYLKTEEGTTAIFDSLNLVISQIIQEQTLRRNNIEADKVLLNNNLKAISKYLD